MIPAVEDILRLSVPPEVWQLSKERRYRIEIHPFELYEFEGRRYSGSPVAFGDRHDTQLRELLQLPAMSRLYVDRLPSAHAIEILPWLELDPLSPTYSEEVSQRESIIGYANAAEHERISKRQNKTDFSELVIRRADLWQHLERLYELRCQELDSLRRILYPFVAHEADSTSGLQSTDQLWRATIHGDYERCATEIIQVGLLSTVGGGVDGLGEATAFGVRCFEPAVDLHAARAMDAKREAIDAILSTWRATGEMPTRPVTTALVKKRQRGTAREARLRAFALRPAEPGSGFTSLSALLDCYSSICNTSRENARLDLSEAGLLREDGKKGQRYSAEELQQLVAAILSRFGGDS